MTSKAIRIRDAIATLLTAPAMTGIGSGGVNVDPDYPFELRDLTVCTVYLGNETAPNRALIGVHDHELTVTVRVVSKGDDSFAIGDSVLVQAYNRIVADLTLGGLALDVIQRGTRRIRDFLEKPVAVTEMDFSVEYRTSTTSMED